MKKIFKLVLVSIFFSFTSAYANEASEDKGACLLNAYEFSDVILRDSHREAIQFAESFCSKPSHRGACLKNAYNYFSRDRGMSNRKAADSALSFCKQGRSGACLLNAYKYFNGEKRLGTSASRLATENFCR